MEPSSQVNSESVSQNFYASLPDRIADKNSREMITALEILKVQRRKKLSDISLKYNIKNLTDNDTIISRTKDSVIIYNKDGKDGKIKIYFKDQEKQILYDLLHQKARKYNLLNQDDKAEICCTIL